MKSGKNEREGLKGEKYLEMGRGGVEKWQKRKRGVGEGLKGEKYLEMGRG